MSKSSITDTPDYRAICKQAAEDDQIFATFKKNVAYNVVLEHTDPKYAPELLELVWKSNLNLNDIHLLKSNDEQGDACLVDVGHPFGLISPSTLRYLKVLADINTLFGSQDGKVVVEIGIGYGGQCKVLSDYYKLAEYHLVDLREPIALAKRYLKRYNYSHVFYHSFDDEVVAKDSYDLFISNYAFSELTFECQKFYLDNFILPSKHGYITCNFTSFVYCIDSMPKEELLRLIPNAKEMPEKPLTFPGNAIIYW